MGRIEGRHVEHVRGWLEMTAGDEINDERLNNDKNLNGGG